LKSLRHKIALFVGLTSLSALVAGVGITVLQYESRVRQESARELDSAAYALPGMVENFGANLLNLARTVSLTPSLAQRVQDKDLVQLTDYLSRSAYANALDFAEITSRDHTVLVNLMDTLAVGRESANPLVAKSVMFGYFGHDVYHNCTELYVLATCPILLDGALIGTLTLGRAFQPAMLRQFSTGMDTRFTVWKDEQRPSVPPAGGEEWPPLNHILEPEDLAGLEAGQAATMDITVGKIPYQSVILPLCNGQGRRQGYFAAYRSMAFLNEALSLTLVHLLLISAGLVVVLGIIALWVSRRVTVPLVTLAQNARRLAALDFSSAIPTEGHAEVRDMAEAFNHLSRELQRSLQQKDRFAADLASLNENLERMVAARTEELSHANQRLKREMAEKEDFLRAVSHDLGAPLRNIAGLVRMIGRRHQSGLSPEAGDALTRINNNVMNELGLIEQLLELSRIKTRRGKPSEIRLADLVEEICQDLSFAIAERQVQVRSADDLPVIFAERHRIRQVFQNLIDNAVKYLGEQPQPLLEIGWTGHQKYYMFWVSDNGIGIPADQKDKIFGVFRRVKTREVMSVEGKGVGLASVKTIVEMYGGEIWVESQPGQGSTFYFTMDRSMITPAGAPEPEDEPETADETSVVTA